jgi:hypothetical protein
MLKPEGGLLRKIQKGEWSSEDAWVQCFSVSISCHRGLGDNIFVNYATQLPCCHICADMTAKCFTTQHPTNLRLEYHLHSLLLEAASLACIILRE